MSERRWQEQANHENAWDCSLNELGYCAGCFSIRQQKLGKREVRPKRNAWLLWGARKLSFQNPNSLMPNLLVRKHRSFPISSAWANSCFKAPKHGSALGKDLKNTEEFILEALELPALVETWKKFLTCMQNSADSMTIYGPKLE